MQKSLKEANSIGLVLSGGGVRGMAHIGLLQALEEHKISVRRIAGSSVGALVGALYAKGHPIKDILQFFKDTPVFQYRFFAIGKPGFMATERYMPIFKKYFPQDTFSSLKLPLHVVATDLMRGKETVFNEGQLTTLNDRYLMKLETENGVQLKRQELFRVPDDVIWGYAHYESADDELGARQFIEKVSEKGTAIALQQGYYGHFTIGAGRIIESVYDQPGAGTVLPFLLEFTGDQSELNALMEQARADYGAEVTLQLFNSLGESF